MAGSDDVAADRNGCGRGRGQDDVRVRVGRRVAADDARAVEVDLDRPFETTQEREVGLAELLPRPLSDLEQPPTLVLADRLGGDVQREQELVGVPEDAAARQLLQQLDALDRLRPALGDVAERDDQVGLYTLDVRERGAERDSVSVHVREKGHSHPAETTVTP